MTFSRFLALGIVGALLSLGAPAFAGMDLKQEPNGALSIYDDSGQGKGGRVLGVDSDALSTACVAVTKYATIARTDTSNKNLFTLPKNAVPLKLWYFSSAASNAGTSANISVGYSTGTEFLNAQDVKTVGTGQGMVIPNGEASLFSPVSTTADTTIVGKYAESGTASSAGGPWNVVLTYCAR
jgi:hypothetical protein